jgi:hypothetical protein
MVLPCSLHRDQHQLFFISFLFLICSFPVVGWRRRIQYFVMNYVWSNRSM